MRRWAGAALLAAVAGCGSQDPAPPAPVSTAEVQRGTLSATVSLDGTLTYRARPDGSPWPAINQAHGTYTELPAAGDEVGCGDVLYRVDDEPVLLLCGAVPGYRDLAAGDEGRDVRQLNRNLHALGHLAGPGDAFTSRTAESLRKLQHARGLEATGALELGAAVVLPKPVRIAKVTGELGGSARPGARVLRATSGRLEVRVELEASQRGEVKAGDRARITLPGNRSTTGTVRRIGRVARTVPASIGLDEPRKARGLDRVPVRVEITTAGVKGVLNVPVTALLGRSGGGFAVEVVRDGERRDLVAVDLGLFDTGDGRVEVEGELDEGDRVVVPSL